MAVREPSECGFVSEEEISSPRKVCQNGAHIGTASGVFFFGRSVEVLSNSAKGWIRGRVVQPSYAGRVTVEFRRFDGSLCLKHLRADSERLRLTPDDSAALDEEASRVQDHEHFSSSRLVTDGQEHSFGSPAPLKTGSVQRHSQAYEEEEQRRTSTQCVSRESCHRASLKNGSVQRPSQEEAEEDHQRRVSSRYASHDLSKHTSVKTGSERWPSQEAYEEEEQRRVSSQCVSRESCHRASLKDGSVQRPTEEEAEDEQGPSGTQREAQRWRQEQEAVAHWEVKELQRFLAEASKLGLVGGNTPLCNSNAWSSKHGVRKLGELVEAVQRVREDVLLVVLRMAEQRNWDDVFHFLSACMASVDSRPTSAEFGFIHHASFQGNVAVLRHLLKMGASITSTTSRGQTPRQVAVAVGARDAVRFLEEAERADRSTRRTVFADHVLGYEAKAHMVFRRTSATLFETKDDPSYSTFCKIGTADGWDAQATSCTAGVTQIRVQVIKPTGPFCFGLTCDPSDDHTMSNGFRVLIGSNGFEEDPATWPKTSQRTCRLMGVEASDTFVMSMTDDRVIEVYHNGDLLQRFDAEGAAMHAKIFIYEEGGCMSVGLEPFVSYPQQIHHSMHLRGGDFKTMLKAVLMKLLPEWLRRELEEGVDPTDRRGHAMYFASLVVMLSTRQWSKSELKGMDNVDRKKSHVPFNYEWTTDLWKVLKKVWNNGDIPRLDSLRAEFHNKIPGSSKNKAILALAFVSVLRPEHRWVAWTCWRERKDDEAKDRFPFKARESTSYAQLHCVCCHLDTQLWFDVIRFWDRDPMHAWDTRYPDPDMLTAPSAGAGNFDLRQHTDWMQFRAGPGGDRGYSCPVKLRGVAPAKLAAVGVVGEFDASGASDEDEEEEERRLPHELHE